MLILQFRIPFRRSLNFSSFILLVSFLLIPSIAQGTLLHKNTFDVSALALWRVSPYLKKKNGLKYVCTRHRQSIKQKRNWWMGSSRKIQRGNIIRIPGLERRGTCDAFQIDGACIFGGRWSNSKATGLSMEWILATTLLLAADASRAYYRYFSKYRTKETGVYYSYSQ